jgi:Tfp pilus assembly protein PilF/4-amino-4-deoxy-L-arabinose transferase-like glycosyltransferase
VANKKKVKKVEIVRPGRSEVWWPLAIFVLAVLIRLLYVFQVRGNPFFGNPVVDSLTYDLQAREIAGGNWLGSDVFWQAPLYPYFLALLYKISGGGILFARALQALLGGVNCVLVYLVAGKIFGRVVGIASGFAMALLGTAVFFDCELLAPVLIIFLSLVLVYLMLQLKMNPLRWLSCGLVLGILIIAHGLAALFFPAALVWIALTLKGKHSGKKTLACCLMFALGCAIPVSSVTLRNYIVGNDFVPVSSNAGINFYIGNSPDYDHTVGLRPGLKWERLNREPLDLGLARHSQRSAFFVKKALASISSHPAQWIFLLAKKLYLFWNGNEVGRNQGIYPFRTYSSVLRLLLWKYFVAFPFGLVGPLALVGIFIAWREHCRIGLVSLFVLATVVSVIMFFVCSRYRMTAVPFLLMFAVFFVVWAVKAIRAGAWGKIIMPLTAFGVLCIVLNMGTGRMPSAFGADDYFALGSSCFERGYNERALKYYEKALDLRPGYPDVLYNMGNMYLKDKEYGKAIGAYASAVESEPAFVEAYYNMGVAYSGLAEYDSAKAAYRESLRLRPGLVQAMVSLGDVFIREEMPDSARPLYERALELDPGNALAHHNLAIVYYAEGRPEEALMHLEEAMRLGMEPNRELYVRLKEMVGGR